MNDKIRNFCIIAHIDHGKSTLADRFLEITGTVDKRKMKTQYLDQLELERERGITIKMAPVRMIYHSYGSHPERSEGSQNSNSEFILNLIDTPGHSDFAYEVSRALVAVEGAILLVDATQGIQAQTLANLRAAEKAGLTVIGAVNKVDLRPFDLDKIIDEMAALLNYPREAIHKISGKTGEGVENLLQSVIEKIPPPNRHESALNQHQSASKALVFDSFYDNHKGIVASIRVMSGEFLPDKETRLLAVKDSFKSKEVGFFNPEIKSSDRIAAGEIGYIATGIKDPDKIKIGDTVVQGNLVDPVPLIGYKEPRPVVFVSFYPEDADRYDDLKTGLKKLRLNDSSLQIDADQNEVLGRGFKVGFLGRLHFEIIAERLKREFDIPLITTFPSVAYKILKKGEWQFIVNPETFEEKTEEIWEPMVKTEIIMPLECLSGLFAIQQKFRMEKIETETVGARAIVRAEMPLAELMSDFDDHLKSMSRGFASFSYELSDYKKSEIVKVDILVTGKKIPGLSRFLHVSVFEMEARKMLERLKELLPRQQFAQALQALANGRVIAREDLPAMKKDVTGHLYGGDRTRKMKLWKKQKRGKENLKERADVVVSPEIFRELLKK